MDAPEVGAVSPTQLAAVLQVLAPAPPPPLHVKLAAEAAEAHSSQQTHPTSRVTGAQVLTRGCSESRDGIGMVWPPCRTWLGGTTWATPTWRNRSDQSIRGWRPALYQDAKAWDVSALDMD